ncbi:hypothetical protein EDO6_00335 [Paenibacillus xylanexedens]|nr:hypothetical protein EDO6_00335 [Paenibacillus xylanexedens]
MYYHGLLFTSYLVSLFPSRPWPIRSTHSEIHLRIASKP